MHSELGKLPLRPGDVELTVDQLLLTPLFANLPESAERRLRSLPGKGAVVMRHFRAGDVVCRQGEPGWTAFYIMRDADLRRLELPDPSARARPASTTRPAFNIQSAPSIAMSTLIREGASRNRPKAKVSIAPARAAKPREEPSLLLRVRDAIIRSKRKVVPVDGSADVIVGEEGRAVGDLHEGELFGEMSCFNHAPRSATVRAIEDCYMLELVRNLLEDALQNEDFKAALNDRYRARALEMHLSSMPIFERASPEAIDLLRRKAELVTLEPGQALYRDGEESDAMYFVRYGTLRLTEGDGRVIRYVSRGDSVGVGSMLAKRPRFASCVALDLGRESVRSRRSSTAGRVELVKISAALFEEVSRMFPELRTTAREIVEQRTQGTGTIGLGVENLAGKLGLVQSEHLMLIDLDRCTRCDDCVRACADTHDGISRLCREGPRFGRFLIPETCRQCLDPTCLIGCPVGSIHRGSDGEIVIEDWCIGCGLCAEQCPYDAIDIAGEEQRRAVVCDQCRSIGDGTPMCVYACGHDAALRVDGRQFFAAGIKK